MNEPSPTISQNCQDRVHSYYNQKLLITNKSNKPKHRRMKYGTGRIAAVMCCLPDNNNLLCILLELRKLVEG